MASIVLRNIKGTPLTNTEVDNNFQYILNAIGASGSTTVPTPSGTGSPVLTNSPVLITPTLGTPASGTLTNCTGLPVTGITGFASGISSFLTSPSSANLLAAITDESGTGSLVFNNNSSFNGTTSINNLTLATALSIANGGTGASDRASALNNLLPSASGISGYVLTTYGPNSFQWAPGGTGGGGGSISGSGGTAVLTTRKIFTATTGQTSFTGLSAYTAGYTQLRVYINGVRQYNTDYTENVTTLSTVAITGTSGQFSCAAASFSVGQVVSITGTNTGTGSISNYTSGKLYYVIGTPTSTSFQLSETLGGSAITTTAGTPVGLTFTTGFAFTLLTGATTGDSVMAEIDSYYSFTQLASATTYTPSGALTAINVQNGIDQLETNKLAKSGGTMTGNLTLVAGTTSSPALKLTSGVTLTSASSGSVEWDGTLLYITNSTNTRKTIAYVDNVHYIGTTSIALNRASASQTLTGVSIDGTAASLVTSGNYQVNSLGVGTAGSGTTGEIRATNNITAYYSSDIKFKNNVNDIIDPLTIVTTIGSKTFEWSDQYINDHGGEDGYFIRKEDFGVIAQDVKGVFPLAVREREDGSLAVDYAKLAILSFGAIKQLMKRIEDLENKD